MKLPIFPLPQFLLPDGMTRLRIFEQRYLNMVKRAQQTKGFAIQLKLSEHEPLVSDIVSWVDIVDFDQTEDGLLSIDVRCHALLQIVSYEFNDDGLMLATTTPHSHWPSDNVVAATDSVISTLEAVCTNHPILNQFYPQPRQVNAIWVYSRWLELLPVPAKQKLFFFANDSFSAAKKFVDAIVMK